MQDFQLDFSFFDAPKEDEDATESEKKHAQARTLAVFKQMPTQMKMRMLSDAALADELPWHFEPGDCWHMITGGEVDGTSVLTHVLRQQKAEYVLLATWCMGKQDIKQLGSLVDDGIIGRLDIYTGEVFKASRHAQPADMKTVTDKTGGRFVRMLNHAKVCLVYGEKVDVCIESSANLNTNPRCENTVITCDTALCDFYKAWYDSQPPEHKGDYGNWKPWER